MRGLITPLVICAMAAAPLVFAVCRVPRKVFIGVVALVGATILAGYVAFAGFGYRFTENLSTSLNGHLYVYKIYVYKTDEPLHKGDLVAYRWRGGFHYAPGAVFIKRIAGMPGDMVKREGRAFFVKGQYIGVAKPQARTGEALEAAASGLIPEGEYFVCTPSPDSLDSRYAATGNVKQREIIGKAYEIF